MAAEATGFEAVGRWLADRGVEHLIVEHDRTLSAEAEADAAGVPPSHAAKTVVLHDRAAYELAVVPASRRLDLDRVRQAIGGSAHLRLATEEEMADAFPDFEVGALPPFGPMLPAPEVVDVHLLYHDQILCGGGDHRHSVLLDPRDLVRVAAPRVADICEHRAPGHDTDFGELPTL
jgi:Ala-tRNA(Pro) deacylase